ncbi:RNA polymerase sigma factor [Bacillus sp. 31A1R]|uniref:RNA polymerase sigma factor n=1 Tax=Robertmurraya mangrovi TaxID=3098077 RepID=A0ABU5IVW6_9BACI|nr:RNA polymerase sigma factor [Bacillus sp. 31A1R]MDZ5471284.1 RNA polymerase sigma factor [Bacillus sp. 31A1R]
MNSEQQLILQIQNGDHDAFGMLVEDLLSSAQKTAYLVLRSRDLVEDAVQLALEDAYISIMRGKEINNFKPWFYRLVYNRSVDLYRKRSRQTYVPIEDSSEAEEKMKTESLHIQLMANENRNEMMSWLALIDENQRIPLLLYYYEDMSIKDISLALGENMNTVKSRLKRGKRKLAELMGKDKKFLTEAETYGIQ